MKREQAASLGLIGSCLMNPTSRTLKIEEDGDRWRGIKPKIRLIGKWLERAGFKPGKHVSVVCVAPGLIELRACKMNNDEPVGELPAKALDWPF